MFKKEKIKILCKTCGKIFLVPPSLKGQKFCSQLCSNSNFDRRKSISEKATLRWKDQLFRNRHKKISIIYGYCGYCGKPLFYRGQKYCSQVCYRNNPNFLDTSRRTLKNLWSKTEFRDYMLSSTVQIRIKKSLNTPEAIENNKCRKLTWWENHPEKRKEMSNRMKNLWKDPDFIEKCLTGLEHRPSSIEIYFQNFLNSNFLNHPYEYTGDGKFWIGRFNPDFIDRKSKKCIELLGCYYHNCLKCFPKGGFLFNIERNNLKFEYYLSKGWKVLKIWEHDLKNTQYLLQLLGGFL
jgi:G:T-mismatch repair DNA endonuclease (very short patch repair protein)